MPLPVAAAAPVVAAGAQALGAIADPIISLINTKRNNETQAEIAKASNQMQYDVAAANIRAQRDENALDRAYNSEEAEKAYQRSVELQAQQAYLNSPEVMLRHYQAAGLNPNLMIKGSGSVASGGSAPAASFSGSVTPQSISPVVPNIEKMPNFVGGLLDAVGKIASIKQVLSDAELKGANTDQIRQTVDLMVRNLQADAVGKEILNKYQPYLLDKDVALKVANITYLEKEASLADLQGETEKAERLLKERQAAVASVEKELKGEQRDNWKLINSHFDEDFKNRQDNLKSQTGANKAAASLDYAQAYRIRELLPGEKSAQVASQALTNAQTSATWEQISKSAVERDKIAREMALITLQSTNQVLTNERMRQYTEAYDKILENALEMDERTLNQMREDYHNVFKYVGAVLGGSGAAVISAGAQLSK